MNLLRWVLVGVCCLLSTASQAQGAYSDQLIVVLVDVNQPQEVDAAITTRFDRQNSRFTYDFDDDINNLGDYAWEEEPFPSTGCFVPEMKLVFRNYTYVVSLYCSAARKYQNSAPFRPSSERMSNDLVFTTSVQRILEDLKYRAFGNVQTSQGLLRQVSAADPLSDPELDAELDKMLWEDEESIEEELDADDAKLFEEAPLPEFPSFDDDDDDDGR